MKVVLRTAFSVAFLCVAASVFADESPTPEQAYRQAVRYENGEGIGRDYAKAYGLYCQAAEAGNADAARALGWMYLNGRGMERDLGAAIYWLRKAAAGGSVHAANLLEHFPTAQPAGAADAGCTRPSAPTTEAAAPVVPVRAPAEYAALADALAPQYDLDPQLVLAVMAVESGFRSDAVSHRNAQGLMQLIPATADRFGVADPFDPKQNVKGGVRYLRTLIDLFKGDLRLALAAYNAGEGTVMRYGGVPPYPETRTYLERIARHYPLNALPPKQVAALAH